MKTISGQFAPHLAAILALSVCWGSAAHAQNSPAVNSMAFEIALSQTQAPSARLELIEAAIAEIENAPAPDLRMYFDLNDLRLDLLVEQARLEEAASLAAALSAFAVENSAVLQRDPIAYAHRAAALFEQSGNARAALNQLDVEANLRLESGQTGAALAQVYRSMERIAEARGDATGAARFAALAQGALAPVDDAVRSSGESGYSEVDVFYATDRARSGETDPNTFYGHGRGDLEYGVVTVSIPSTHTAGAIELPSVWKLEFGPKPTKHVMLRKVTPKDSAAFFAEMQNKVSDSPRKEAFVFVHGFNTRFDAAARRAAQLAYDMNYSGVPILYSWPSAGKTFSYVADTAVVRLSGRRLAHFLEELHANSGAETIHIVAHSMGNRALTDALELLALKSNAAESATPMFGQLFFAAPDVDAGLFREMMRTIRPIGQRMTLYASEVDWALEASRKLHGHAPRAGQGGADILTAPEFDSVDMSTLGEDMLAHTYFANDSSAITDIASLIWRNPDPARRCGLAPPSGQEAASVWHYEKGTCQDGRLVAMISQLWNRATVTPDVIRQEVQALVPNEEEANALEKSLVTLIGED